MVAGDIGPSGGILAPLGELEPSRGRRRPSPSRPAALIEGGVDVIWIETMSSLEEMRAAIDGVRQASADIPIVATMTFDTRGRTMMGVTPEQAVATLSGWGASAVGGNCGNGPDEILAVIDQDAGRRARRRCWWPRPMPACRSSQTGRAVYGAGPEEMARYAAAAADAGARVDRRLLRQHAGACAKPWPMRSRRRLTRLMPEIAKRMTTALIACGALAREVLALKRQAWLAGGGAGASRRCCTITPDRIPEAVRGAFAKRVPRFERVIVVYGDCGTGGRARRLLAAEGVERVAGPHCYEMYANGRFQSDDGPKRRARSS